MKKRNFYLFVPAIAERSVFSAIRLIPLENTKEADAYPYDFDENGCQVPSIGQREQNQEGADQIQQRIG